MERPNENQLPMEVRYHLERHRRDKTPDEQKIEATLVRIARNNCAVIELHNPNRAPLEKMKYSKPNYNEQKIVSFIHLEAKQ